MNKKKENKKDETPIDIQSELKTLSYNINIKETDILDLERINSELKNEVLNLRKENQNLINNFKNTFNKEKNFEQIYQEKDTLERENKRLQTEIKNYLSNFEIQTEELKKKHNKEIAQLINLLDSYNQKIETANAATLALDKQNELVESLKIEIEKVKEEADNKIKSKIIKNGVKFADLKKKMMDNISDTQKNVTQLNIDYMDTSTKLTLLQNHQLLIEMEFQSQQIEDLIMKKDSLEKKVYELNKDIEVHKEVEFSLASKNKKLNNTIANLENQIATFGKNMNVSERSFEECDGNVNAGLSKSMENDNSNTLNVNASKNINSVLQLEKKINNLQLSAKKKQMEYDRMRHNFSILEEKLKSYEFKFANIISLYEIAIEKVSLEIQNNNFKIDLNTLKKCNFESLNNEEKYAVLLLLVKQVIPLLGEKDSTTYQEAFEKVKVVSKRQNKNNLNLEDPLLKKLFKPNFKNINTYHNHFANIKLDTLPIINTKRSTSNFDLNGKPNRVNFINY